MKKMILGLAAFMVLLTGCEMKSGEELMKAPKLTGEQEVISKAIKAQIPNNAKMVSPMSGDNKNAIQFCDLDNDGEDEVVVFYKEEDTQKPVTVKVLDRNGQQWESTYEIAGSGSEVDKIYYADVTGDKKKELIIGWRLFDQTNKGVSIYKIGNNKKEIFGASYSEMVMTDFDQNEVQELCVTQPKKDTAMQDMVLYRYHKDGVSEVSRMPINMGTDGRFNNMIFGNINANRRGVFLDLLVGEKSYTKVIGMENGALLSLFETGEDIAQLRDVHEKCQDINSDGIVEIPIVRAMPSYENVDSIVAENVVSWNIWQEGALLEVEKSFNNYIDGYLLIYPAVWKNEEITVNRKNSQGENKIEFLMKVGFDYKPVLTIYSYYVKDLKNTDLEGKTEITRTLNNVYAVSATDLTGVDFDVIKNNFKIVSW